jgi:hypothetical protein
MIVHYFLLLKRICSVAKWCQFFTYYYIRRNSYGQSTLLAAINIFCGSHFLGLFDHLINVWEFKPGLVPRTCDLYFLVDLGDLFTSWRSRNKIV